jgi:hypothetical protein
MVFFPQDIDLTTKEDTYFDFASNQPKEYQAKIEAANAMISKQRQIKMHGNRITNLNYGDVVLGLNKLNKDLTKSV